MNSMWSTLWTGVHKYEEYVKIEVFLNILRFWLKVPLMTLLSYDVSLLTEPNLQVILDSIGYVETKYV